MLDGRPAVFLSCAEQFKTTVARPVREALNEHGVHGIIVSDEPLLPRVPSDPDSKVNSYLDASDALVALCTADDELADGTVQTRPNILNEIQRAFDRPGLRDKVLVLAAPGVKLPSNINPTYNRLDVDDIAMAVEHILPQLQVWGVIARQAQPAPAPVSQPTPLDEPATVNDLVDGLSLGDDDKSTKRAYALLYNETRRSQRAIVLGSSISSRVPTPRTRRPF